jgi:hypothetical protein
MPQLLADRMSAAWANFARKGDPNGGKTITWPKYNSITRPTMVRNESPAGPRIENDPPAEQRKRMLAMARSNMRRRRRGRADRFDVKLLSRRHRLRAGLAGVGSLLRSGKTRPRGGDVDVGFAEIVAVGVRR